MDTDILMKLRDGLLLYITLVCSLSIHEWAHAFTADKLNDPLPRYQGRVTLNPLAHMDVLGTVIIPLIMIFAPIVAGGSNMIALVGWGKPVMISLPNPKTRVRDDLLITSAGPLSNLVLCGLLAIAGGIIIPFSAGAYHFFLQGIFLNAALFCFNLIPIPPLDGSHYLKHILKLSQETFMRLSQYGFIILLLLINFPTFRILFSSIITKISSVFFFLLIATQKYVLSFLS